MWRRRGRRGWSGPAVESAADRSGPRALPQNEFDAYLDGSYVTWLLSNGQPVPGWAWLNRVAHGQLDDIRAMATHLRRLPATREEVGAWQQVAAFLAKEVVAAAGDEEQLLDLQRRVLVPVELHLAEEWWAALKPIDLATTVVAALHDSRRRQ